MPSTPLRVLLAGTGRMGSIRAKALYSNPSFNLIGIIDTNLQSAKNLSSKYHINRAWKSIDDAFDDTSSELQENPPDCIVVSTSTSTHPEIFEAASKRNLHIFVEKPVSSEPSVLSELFNLTDKSNLILACGFQRRFDQSYIATHAAVTSPNGLGKVNLSNVIFHDCPTPSTDFLLGVGGCVFMDLAPHDIDYVQFVHQSLITSVYAIASSSNDVLKRAKVCDNATMVCTFDNGSVSTINMSRSSAYGYDQRAEFFCNKGSASVNNQNQTSSRIMNGTGVIDSRLKNSFPDRFEQAFMSELEYFAKCVNDSNNPSQEEEVVWPVNKEDCMYVQRVAKAASLSAELGRVVEVSEIAV